MKSGPLTENITRITLAFMVIGVCSVFGLGFVTTACVVVGTATAWTYNQMLEKKNPQEKRPLSEYFTNMAVAFIFFYFSALGVCKTLSGIFFFLRGFSE